MKNPIDKIMNARTIEEVDRIIMLNWKFFIDHPALLELARTSKKRIRKLDEIKRKNWFTMMN